MQEEVMEERGRQQELEEEEVREEEYDETFAELNRRAASNIKSPNEKMTEELDALEYSQEEEEEEEGRGVYDSYQPDHKEEEDEEETASEDEYEEDEEEEGEGGQSSAAAQEKTVGTKTHLYENKFTKPVLQLGGTTLTYGEAKLYGLLGKDGEVKLERPGAQGKTEKPRSKAEAKQAMNSLAKKKDLSKVQPEAKDEDVTECSFKPKRSKEADRAMKNPSCGYDFVTRLGEGGDFLKRNSGKDPKANADDRSDAKKEDYEASLGKLQCPQCRKYQSFDEYVEKRRVCGTCQQRYARLNVVNMNSWKQRQQQAEQMKQERLKKIEEDFYGDASFAPKLNRTAKSKTAPSLTERTAQVVAKQKEDAMLAKKRAEEAEAARVEKEKQQVAAARRNRAAARKQDMENLHAGAGQARLNKSHASSKGDKGGQSKFATLAAKVNTATKTTKRKPSSFNKTENNISAKFDKLLS